MEMSKEELECRDNIDEFSPEENLESIEIRLEEVEKPVRKYEVSHDLLSESSKANHTNASSKKRAFIPVNKPDELSNIQESRCIDDMLNVVAQQVAEKKTLVEVNKQYRNTLMNLKQELEESIQCTKIKKSNLQKQINYNNNLAGDVQRIRAEVLNAKNLVEQT